MKAVIFVAHVLFIIWPVSCSPCSRAESLNITNGVKHSNGSVIHDQVEYTSGTWYEVEEDSRVVLLGCPCIGRICLWKCCGISQAFYDRNCTDSDLSVVNPFSPPLYKGKEVSNSTSREHFFFMYGYPCIDRYLVDTNNNEELFIQENGTLHEVAPGGMQWHDPKRYCVDMKVDVNTMTSRLVAGVCYPDTVETDDSPILYTAYAIGLMLSVPFLLATFLVYALIPELRNLHGMSLMAYCGGLIIAYSFLAYLKLHVGRIGVGMTACHVIAFIVYYAFQTSFFWLNVMCFDIWRTFSGYRGGSSSKRRDIKRFAMYGAYAWGVPIALTACTAAMQFSDQLPAGIITPGFGSRRCWFVDWLSELVYFFTPVLVLVVCNVLLFTVTAHRIRSIKQETAILKGAESSRSDKLKKDKQRYGLYLKLFMVMGVNWLAELIGFVVGGSNWYYIVIDIANIGLGLYIFLIFVWKKKVRNLVQKRFRNMFGMGQTQSDTRTSKWMTGSSSAPTEDTRVSSDETAVRLRDMH